MSPFNSFNRIKVLWLGVASDRPPLTFRGMTTDVERAVSVQHFVGTADNSLSYFRKMNGARC